MRLRSSTGGLCSVLAFWLGACEKPPTRLGECLPAPALASCSLSSDTSFCRFGQRVESRVDLETFRAVVDQDLATLEEAIGAFFPAGAGKPLFDAPVPEPAGLVFTFSAFPPYPVPSPIDWGADPFENNSWQLYFQNLSWLADVAGPEGDGLEAAAWVVVQYADHQLFADDVLYFSWEDHAIAERATQVARFTEAYVQQAEVLNLRVLHAAARILLTHASALMSLPCYIPRQNHGVMQDLALLRLAGMFPHLQEASEWWTVAEQRLVGQQLDAVTDDGIHIENSPAYHAFFAELMTDVLDAYVAASRPPPARLVWARDALLVTFPHLLQPDLSFPQFGDTPNGRRDSQAGALLERRRDQLRAGVPAGVTGVEPLLAYVASSGAEGDPPSTRHRVFDIGGYAAFRSDWDIASPGTAVAGHLTSNRLSPSHAHDDETSIEIFAYGSTLVADSGHFNYDSRDAFSHYQVSAAAHSVLIIDEAAFEPSGLPGIVASGGGEDAPWVQAQHGHYQHLGVDGLVRSFGWVAPDVFVVVDSVDANGAHDYAQHFQLHPDVAEVAVDATGSVIGRVANGPSVVFTPLYDAQDVRTERGVEGDRVRGWYFPAPNEAVERADLSFIRSAHGPVDLGILIRVLPPGAEPAPPVSAELLRSAGALVVRWRWGEQSGQLSVPAP